MIIVKSTYCLGYGSTYPVALEGALKLKEVTDIHCEGLLSTEFKHGPLAAVREGYPIIFIASPEDVSLIVSGINEVACRGAKTIVIGEENHRLQSNANGIISIPQSNQITTLFWQLSHYSYWHIALAYHVDLILIIPEI